MAFAEPPHRTGEGARLCLLVGAPSEWAAVAAAGTPLPDLFLRFACHTLVRTDRFELSTLSADFRTLWAAHDVRIRHDGIKRLQHPEVGLIELTYQSVDLPVSRRAVHDLNLYTAEPGSTSEERLKLLASLAATPFREAEPTDRLR